MYLPRPFYSTEGQTGAPAEAADAANPASVDTGNPAPDGAGGQDQAGDTGAPLGESLLTAAESKKPAEATAETEAKPEAAKAGGEGKEPPAEAKPDEAGKPEPIHLEPFTVPDGLNLDEQRLGEFSALMSNAELSPHERGQKLLDLYAQEMKAVSENYAKQQFETWRDLNDGWKDELRKDPDIGGNRMETALAIGKAVIEDFGGTPEQQAELLAHIDRNGMGNYVGFARLMHNVGKALNIFEDSYRAAPGSKPIPQSRAERWYGGNRKSA